MTEFRTRAVPIGVNAELDILFGMVDPVAALQSFYDAQLEPKPSKPTQWDDLPAVLNPVQVGRLLSVSPDKVRGWIRSGSLAAADLGSGRSQFAIRKVDLEAFLRERQPVKVEPRRLRAKPKNPNDRY